MRQSSKESKKFSLNIEVQKSEQPKRKKTKLDMKPPLANKHESTASIFDSQTLSKQQSASQTHN